MVIIMQERTCGLGFITSIACLSFIASCAGPMDPFGAKPILGQAIEQLQTDQSEVQFSKLALASDYTPGRAPASTSTASIEFYPPKKLWHRAFDLTVTIKDRTGLNQNSKIMFYYDGEDVTDRVVSYARTKYSGDGNKVEFTIPAFRLLPEQDKALMVAYAKLDPMGLDQVIGKVYEEPNCPMLELQALATPTSMKGFQTNDKLIAQIRSLSSFNHVNPALVAGLIAQESSFDPRAVSAAKALGLTQITSLAEQHILEDLGERAAQWPRYPGLNEMNPMRIKALIALGRINANNEWRLKQDRSIQGGISYLQYINNYWQNYRPLVNRRLASLTQDKLQNELVDLILASYNSGAYRVRKNLDRLGPNWLEARDLGEARKYVHNVKSYCYDFARGY